MSGPVVAVVSPRTLDVCRSSVRSIRGDRSFMPLSFNDSGPLCTPKLGLFFSFLPLLMLGQRRKKGSLLTSCFLNKPLYSVEGCISLTFFYLLDCLSPQSQVSLPPGISSVPLIIAPGCLGWHFLYCWCQFLLIVLWVRRSLTTCSLFKAWHQWAPELLSV